MEDIRIRGAKRQKVAGIDENDEGSKDNRKMPARENEDEENISSDDNEEKDNDEKEDDDDDNEEEEEEDCGASPCEWIPLRDDVVEYARNSMMFADHRDKMDPLSYLVEWFESMSEEELNEVTITNNQQSTKK